MPRYALSIPVTFVAGLLMGRYALGRGWVVAAIIGVGFSLLFNGAFWWSGSSTRKGEAGTR
jgi:hypothetical protein